MAKPEMWYQDEMTSDKQNQHRSDERLGSANHLEHSVTTSNEIQGERYSSWE
jgi:hypothetical protein